VASARTALDDTAAMRGKDPLTALNIKGPARGDRALLRSRHTGDRPGGAGLRLSAKAGFDRGTIALGQNQPGPVSAGKRSAGKSLIHSDSSVSSMTWAYSRAWMRVSCNVRSRSGTASLMILHSSARSFSDMRQAASLPSRIEKCAIAGQDMPDVTAKVQEMTAPFLRPTAFGTGQLFWSVEAVALVLSSIVHVRAPSPVTGKLCSRPDARKRRGICSSRQQWSAPIGFAASAGSWTTASPPPLRTAMKPALPSLSIPVMITPITCRP
jgi:hypothetical protein